MNILLINTNPVVARLFSLSTQEDDNVLYQVSDIKQIDALVYDIIFIDDASYNEESEEFLLSLDEKEEMSKKVLISSKQKVDSTFDEIIKKPFLPSKIIQTINKFSLPLEMQIPEIETVEELSKEEPLLNSFEGLFEREEKSTSSEPSILDSNELDKIKLLLEMDNELNEEMPLLEEEKKVKKEKKPFVLTEKDEELIEEAVEIIMTKLSEKQMKKLLKGKEIEIKIKLEDIE